MVYNPDWRFRGPPVPAVNPYERQPTLGYRGAPVDTRTPEEQWAAYDRAIAAQRISGTEQFWVPPSVPRPPTGVRVGPPQAQVGYSLPGQTTGLPLAQYPPTVYPPYTGEIREMIGGSLRPPRPIPPWLPEAREMPGGSLRPPRGYPPVSIYQSPPFQGNLGQPLSQYPVQPRPLPTGEPVEMVGGMQRPPRPYLPDYIRQLQAPRGGANRMWEATY